MKIDLKLRESIKKRIMDEIRNPAKRVVVISSAVELSSHLLDDIVRAFPELKGAQIRNEVNPEIIGGFIIEDGSTIMDYSVKGKMSEIVQNLLAS